MRLLVKLLVALDDGFLLDPEGVPYPLMFTVRRDNAAIELGIEERWVKNSVVDAVSVSLTVELRDELFDRVRFGENAVQYKRASEGGIPDDIDAFYRHIFRNAVWALNRLITAFRVAAHQTWLDDMPSEDDFIGNFFHRVRSAQLCVDGEDHTLAAAPYAFMLDGGRNVANSDRLEAVRTLVASGRVPLAAELLANAERLWEQAHYRAAAVEIGAAIEATIHRFASRPDMARLNADRIGRLPISMDKIVGELGLRGSVRVLVPLLVPETLLDDYALELVIAAIEMRNEVIHSGKRTLDKERIWDCLIAARELHDGLPLLGDDR